MKNHLGVIVGVVMVVVAIVVVSRLQNTSTLQGGVIPIPVGQFVCCVTDAQNAYCATKCNPGEGQSDIEYPTREQCIDGCPVHLNDNVCCSDGTCTYSTSLCSKGATIGYPDGNICAKQCKSQEIGRKVD